MPYCSVNRFRINKLKSKVVNSKYCIGEDILSEFRDRMRFFLSSIYKYCLPPSGFICLMKDFSLETWQVGTAHHVSYFSSCYICAVGELPQTRYWAAGTYIAAVSPSCKLSHILSAFAEVHRGAEHPVCLVFFCLPHTSTGRILVYIFPLLLWNWITAVMIVFNSWKCWGYPIAEVSYFKHHMPGKVCWIPPA